MCVCARARLCALWGPAWCAATGGGCASHGSRDAIQCSRSRGRCGGATILLPELRAVACTRPLAYSTLLLPPPLPQPPLPPPANASSLQLPPSAPPSAPPSPLAPEANPAPEDQPQPPPPLPLAPPADHNSSPGTRWLGGFIPEGRVGASLDSHPFLTSPGFFCTKTLSPGGGRHLHPEVDPPCSFLQPGSPCLSSNGSLNRYTDVFHPSPCLWDLHSCSALTRSLALLPAISLSCRELLELRSTPCEPSAASR